jgi:hypothetical protein
MSVIYIFKYLMYIDFQIPLNEFETSLIRQAENSQLAYQNDTTVEGLALRSYVYPPYLEEARLSFTQKLKLSRG